MRIEKVVHVGPASASANACDLGKGPCTVPLTGGGEVTLELGPRPLGPCASSPSRRTSAGGGAPMAGAEVHVSFAMKGMQMGTTRRRSRPRATAVSRGGRARALPERTEGLDRGLTVAQQGVEPRTARFALTVAE